MSLAKKKQDSPLNRGFSSIRQSLWMVFLLSLVLNLLMLVSPVYMLQIYDRVLVARNMDTLILLSTVVIGALMLYGVLYMLRGQAMVRVSARFDRLLSAHVFSSMVTAGRGGQPLKDMETLRAFLTGNSLIALFDAPWSPLYIGLVYLLHPLLGHLVLAGAGVLLCLTLINEASTRGRLQEAGMEFSRAGQFAELSSQSRDAVISMGMMPGLLNTWRHWHDSGLSMQSIASDRMNVIAGISKFIRMVIQSAMLGIGAFLVIQEEITAGVMIATSIIGGRALAPVDQAIAGWRSFIQARAARQRLIEQFERFPIQEDTMSLPAPKGELLFDNVYAGPPESERPTLSAISFKLEAGKTLGITGHSAAGKSTLARLMVGIWQPSSGHVRLDLTDMRDWDRVRLGPHIGYLPQDVELFPGTIAENIARFGKVDPEAVMLASRLAGAHEAISLVPGGYDAQIGPGGQNLSGGQRQRIGIARAIYGNPPLIVLDEPTSNLDSPGEAAMRQLITEMKQRGSSVVVIAHRPTILGGVDLLMVLKQGAIVAMGSTAEVMPRITRQVNLSAGDQAADVSVVRKGEE